MNQDLDFSKLSLQEKEALLKQLLQERIDAAGSAFPLSVGQRGLWYNCRIHGDNPSNHIGFAERFHLPIDIAVLKKVLTALINRHQCLNTIFLEEGGIPLQKFSQDLPLQFLEIDLCEGRNDDLGELLRRHCELPFSFAQGPLYRFVAFKTSNTDFVLLFVIHHILFDAWSIYLFKEELKLLLQSELCNTPLQFPPVESSPKDFVQWQEQYLQSANGESARKYWESQLAGYSNVLDLPTDYPQAPNGFSSIGSSYFLQISERQRAKLNQLARSTGATPYAVLLAVLFVLLHFICRRHSLLIGCPMAGRLKKEFARAMGFFANMVAIRVELNENPSFEELLFQVTEKVRNGISHQEYPLQLVANQFLSQLSKYRPHVFQVAFNYMRSPDAARYINTNYHTDINLDDLHSSELPIPFGEGQFDLRLDLKETDSGIFGQFMFNAGIFKESTVAVIARSYSLLLDQILENPQQPIYQLSLLDGSDKARIAKKTKPESKASNTISQLLNLQASKTPDAIAVSYLGEVITYRELSHRANNLAKAIRKTTSGSNTTIAIMSHRSIDMIVGILAIIKSGSAYMPLELSWPEDRIRFILQDSGAKILLTPISLGPQAVQMLDSLPIQCMLIEFGAGETGHEGNEIEEINTADDIAYILYTSGSTGAPKGAAIEHRNIINLVEGLYERIYQQYNGPLRIALVAPYVFDASVQQIFASLILGHTLIIVPEETRFDGNSLLEFYSKNLIDISDGTPVIIKLMTTALKAGVEVPAVRHFIIGGEELPPHVLNDFFDQFPDHSPLVSNIYGLTECCVDTTMFTISKGEVFPNRIPIGTPLKNQEIWIIGPGNQPLPAGLHGEICIGGGNLGRGYLNQTALQSSKFIPHPFDEGQYIFRTADLGVIQPSGLLYFLGRMDQQIKIRGYRIEPGEIEALMKTYTSVSPIDESMARFANLENLSQSVRRCKTCLLSENYPGIHFNEAGICNVCEGFSKHEAASRNYFTSISDLESRIAQAKSKTSSEYDCLLLFSGGKDSSYVLYRLVQMGLKVLAYTFDNGYISPTALKNIERITQSLQVDSIIGTTENMDEIFVESLKKDATVCSGCFETLTILSTKLAHEKNINLIFTGLSRGQIFETKLKGLFEKGVTDTLEVEENLKLFRKIYHTTNSKTSRLLNEDIGNVDLNSFYFEDFFRFDPISSVELLEFLKATDEYWRHPEDTGFCSSNCLINDIGICVHSVNQGYHNYESPLSWDIRLGVCEREDALSKVIPRVNPSKLRGMLVKIGFFEKKIQEVAVVQKWDAKGEPYLCAYFQSKEPINSIELRNFLSKKLPQYMIPSKFFAFEHLPTSFNGKVDRKYLQQITDEDMKAAKSEDSLIPSTPVELQLAEIWRQVLQVDHITIGDNFFELGGNSIQAIQTISKIRERLHKDVAIQALLHGSTFGEIARIVEESPDIAITTEIRRVSREQYKKVN